MEHGSRRPVKTEASDDTGDHCRVDYRGMAGIGYPPLSLVEHVISTTFSHMVVGEGLGDYPETLARGLPDGRLYATWNQPVPATGCTMCQGTGYEYQVKGAWVAP